MRKSIISIVIVLSLLFGLTWNVGATFVETQINKNLSVEELADKYLTVTKIEDENGEKTVSEGIDVLKTKISASRPGISDLELAKEIHISLGYSDEFIKNLPDDKLLEILECKDIIQEVNYIKVSEDGKSEISKSEVLKELYLLEDISIEGKKLIEDNKVFVDSILDRDIEKSASGTNNSSTLNSSDGYIRIVTEYLRLSEDNTYANCIVRATESWLKFPSFRGKDILLIVTNGFYESDYNDYGYHEYTYYITDSSGNRKFNSDKNIFFKNNPAGSDDGIGIGYGPGTSNVYISFDLFNDAKIGKKETLENHSLVSYFQYKCYFEKTSTGTVQAAYSHKGNYIGDITVGLTGTINLSVTFTGTDHTDYYGAPMGIRFTD